ncbi:MAG: hypothetical protein HOU81_25520 [Hamadaea sp.]|nr:hypothetical protein [Hamadaea sp.]NUS45927.1 hypothetical protein [Mycobacteriaceae bacterium]
MGDQSPFGLRLWRLLWQRHRVLVEYSAGMLARTTDISYPDLREVLHGSTPNDEMLRRLGPALGIHAADLFVIAGLEVPIDLAPAGPTSPWDVRQIVRTALTMSAGRRVEFGELIQSLPVEPRTDPMPMFGYPDGPGGMLLRLVRNRNIRPWCARILHAVGDGPYVDDSTVAMLGSGRVVITPQYVTAFAHLCGYAPEEMVALVGVGPAITSTRAHPASAEIAALAWNARGLTSDQIEHAVEAVRR